MFGSQTGRPVVSSPPAKYRLAWCPRNNPHIHQSLTFEHTLSGKDSRPTIYARNVRDTTPRAFGVRCRSFRSIQDGGKLRITRSHFTRSLRMTSANASGVFPIGFNPKVIT